MPPKSTPDKTTIRTFRRRLLAWFRSSGRKLPWRETRDPYRIVVSEFMLQQTQVARVVDFYDRFLERYPTLTDLAQAHPSAVRESWDGLGYYRRAANLHRLAQAVVEEHDGILPADVDLLMTLPGVGRYTAGAVASFAYQRAEPAVDTNVARVLTRAFHPRAGPRARDTAKLWSTAGALMPAAGPDAWAFNQGLMELGALVCTARVAKCRECPVRAVCKTGRRGRSGAGLPNGRAPR